MKEKKPKIQGPDGAAYKGYKVKQLKVLTASDVAKSELAKNSLKAKKEAPVKKKASGK